MSLTGCYKEEKCRQKNNIAADNIIFVVLLRRFFAIARCSREIVAAMWTNQRLIFADFRRELLMRMRAGGAFYLPGAGAKEK
ncbi:hypothetical protein J2125_000339 [Erwinia toletana]|uniref:Uncharacterized protein n=1 Tax=Winslowiella toletana TaxID=92490 RepID=A0ABS4P3B1_9GAMM|nr:hypothetical protein [Winslowiella toletana]